MLNHLQKELILKHLLAPQPLKLSMGYRCRKWPGRTCKLTLYQPLVNFMWSSIVSVIQKQCWVRNYRMDVLVTNRKVPHSNFLVICFVFISPQVKDEVSGSEILTFGK